MHLLHPSGPERQVLHASSRTFGAAIDFDFTTVFQFFEVDCLAGVRLLAPLDAFPFVLDRTISLFFAMPPDFSGVLVFLKVFNLAVMYTFTAVLDFTEVVALTGMLPLAAFFSFLVTLHLQGLHSSDDEMTEFWTVSSSGQLFSASVSQCKVVLLSHHHLTFYPCSTVMATWRTTDHGRHIFFILRHPSSSHRLDVVLKPIFMVLQVSLYSRNYENKQCVKCPS